MAKLGDTQIRTVIGLIEPMGEMIEMLQRVILAHHPACVGPDDCRVCKSYEDALDKIIERWSDARAHVSEHWDI